MPEVRGARPAPRAHWLALIVVLLAITAALALNGYVSGELTDAGYVRPPGPAAQVPESISTEGPCHRFASRGGDECCDATAHGRADLR